jgi:hypothetical protein
VKHIGFDMKAKLLREKIFKIKWLQQLPNIKKQRRSVVLCLGLHSNVMIHFVTQTLQGPPSCSPILKGTVAHRYDFFRANARHALYEVGLSSCKH